MSGAPLLRDAVAAEGTKLWSVRSTWWCLGTAVLLQAAYAVLLGVDARVDLEGSGSASDLALGDAGLLSFQFAQYALIAWALLAVTSEFSSGLISTTLRCVPVRGRALAAKTIVVGGSVGLAGAGLMLVAAAGAAAGGGGAVTFSAGQFLVDTVATAGYAAAIAVFTVGLGAALRSAVGGLTAVLVLAVVLPAVLPRIDLHAVEVANDYLPGSASVAVLYGSLVNPGVALPYGLGTAMLVLAGWAVSSFGAGYLWLRRRDA
jgi:ABC-2 type transport system permease protein